VALFSDCPINLEGYAEITIFLNMYSVKMIGSGKAAAFLSII
jgi:hypothetical protein